MILSDLPIEILRKIIRFVTIPIKHNENEAFFTVEDTPPPDCFVLNTTKYSPSIFHDLISLSSTCKYFRILLGPLLFQSVSLIRENEIDSLLQSSAEFRYFSDGKKYYHQVMNEILETGFEKCLKSDITMNKRAESPIDNTSLISDYQRLFSMNNYISILECDNLSIDNIESGIFPHLKTLKIFDTAIDANKQITTQSINVWKSMNLDYLSINSTSLKNYEPIHYCIPQLRRLDLLCQLSQMHPEEGFSCILKNLNCKFKLKQLNLVINDNCFVKYSEFLSFLSDIFNKSPNLEILSIRVSYRKVDESASSTRNWKLYDEQSNGLKFINIINSGHNLQNCILDLSLFSLLTFLENENLQITINKRTTPLTISLVEPILTTRSFPMNLKVSFAFFMLLIGATKLNFFYGEVLNHKNAHESIQDVLLVISRLYQNGVHSTFNLDHNCSIDNKIGFIQRVCIEKCWSEGDEMIRRHYYTTLSEFSLEKKLDYKSKLKLKQATIWGKLPSNSPSYRNFESFSTSIKNAALSSPISNNQLRILEQSNSLNMGDASTTPTTDVTYIPELLPSLNTEKDLLERSLFWSVESSYLDLEEYSYKSRRSRLFAY